MELTAACKLIFSLSETMGYQGNDGRSKSRISDVHITEKILNV